MTEAPLIRRRSFLGAVGICGAGGFVSGLSGRMSAVAAPSERLTIVNPAGTDTLVYQELLETGNYFGSFGVDPKISYVSDGTKVLAALVSGDGDMCAGGGFSSLFPAIERGAKIKILAGAILTPDTCIYSKRAEIRTTKDLIGRTVGTGPPGAVLHELAVALLIKKGVDYRKVNFVNVGSSGAVFKAIVAGTVDAGVAAVDFYDQQKKYGVHVLSDAKLWDEVPEYTDQAMFASDQAIAAKRDALVRSMAAHAKLFRFISRPDSHDAWIKASVAALGKKAGEDAVGKWNFFQKPGRLATGLVLTEQRVAYVQTLNVLLGTQKKVLPFDQVADMSLARDALKLL